MFIGFLTLLHFFAPPGVLAAPFAPTNDTAVIERLRLAPLSAEDRQLRTLRAAQRTRPDDLTNAVTLARALITRARAEADPRHLAHAQAALAPWWSVSDPPTDVLVLRATIRQSLHDFPAALPDLELALRRDSRNAAAWLTKATIHTVRGEFANARRACLQLTRLTDELTAVTATAAVASLTGEAAASHDLLQRTLEQSASRQPQVTVEQRVWALTTLAEIAARLGRANAAESHFLAALELAPADPYLLGAYSDFLLDQERPEEVIDVLWKFTRIDALLLRLAEADVRSPKSDPIRNPQSPIRNLEARFGAARLRNDSVHRREEARFALRLQHDVPVALALAKENWLAQKEPADARLLLEAARAAGDAAVAQSVRDWIRTNRLEDVALEKLMKFP